MDESLSTTTLRFSCACHQVTGSVEVPTSKLPLPFDFCHCNICRHQTGLICASYVTLPDEAAQIKFDGPLSRYKSSNTVTRTFCSNCGANIYVRDSTEPKPDICTGVLEKSEGLLKVRNHIFVPDAKDGGLTAWISDIPCWEGFSQPHRQSQQMNIGPQKQSRITQKGSLELQAYCQCRGVQFTITRPNEASKDLSSPYSDLLWADVTGGSLENKHDVKWWLCADDKRYLAGTCACHSCRLSSGFDIQMWAFIPKGNILQIPQEPPDLGMGSLKQYQSSDGVYREFCYTCGATVFWHGNKRPNLLDISVGLLDAEEGARAESWLEWRTDRVSFEEEAQNKDLISRLAVGLKSWGSTASSLAKRK